MASRWLRAVLTVPALAGVLAIRPAAAQPVTSAREVKWFRDSREYVEVARQTYRLATAAVGAAAARQRGPWAVVVDVDETVLDNSAYQLERAAYGLPFDSASWNGWVRRAEAGAIPGVAEFLGAVRAAGGRVAFLSGREESLTDATRRNLAALALWTEGDLICLRDAANTYTKRARREEIRAGTGRCAWDRPVAVLAYVGDTMGDFPTPDEEPGEFGTTFFILPNPMYGSWERGVTR